MKTTTNTEVFDRFVEQYEAWYETHQEVFASELGAIREHFERLPEDLHGIEVGLGTGQFAVPLGIREGVEPSLPMAAKAIERGIEVIQARAETLPYGDMQFDFVLLVTVCHLDHPKRAFQEAFRVLKRGGSILVGFLPKDRPVAQGYMERKGFSTFYKNAVFHDPAAIEKWLTEAGFKSMVFNQVLFGELEDINKVQLPKPGYGEGSFVVVSAVKP